MSEQLDKLKTHLLRAVELDAAERQRYLDALRAADSEIHDRVVELLAFEDLIPPSIATAGAHERLRALLSQERARDSLAPGAMVGPYQIIREIASGGMGTVHLAQQLRPVRRPVALKVAHMGLQSREVLIRFQIEQQALAQLDHPNIAKIFDAGVLENNEPYFVMEYIDGNPIHHYCDSCNLAVERRLVLFDEVCRAIQHAHQRGILHRDIKPSNVLVVDGEEGPKPKVIDFGVAKATQQGLARATVTLLGQFVGTFEYMSPEQADPAVTNVSAAADVYSLGVLLYELLTGNLPIELGTWRDRGILEIQRTLREVDPPPMTQRLKTLGAELETVAARRSTSPRRLQQRLHGDLEWIVRCALAKDPSRRYGSVDALAEDVRRHLSGDPVSVGPPSASYRVAKLIRRNPVVFASAGTAVVLLIASVGVVTSLYVRAKSARAMARQEARKSERVQSFLESMLSSADPSRGAQDLSVRDLLDQASTRLEEELVGEPQVHAEVAQTIGRTYTSLGLYEKARSQLESAVAISESLLGPQHPEYIANLQHLALAVHNEGRLAEADSLYAVIAAWQEVHLEPTHPDRVKNVRNWADVAMRREDTAGARDLLEQTIGDLRRAKNPNEAGLAQLLDELGRCHAQLRETEKARRCYEEALEIMLRLSPPRDPNLTGILTRLASTLFNLGELERAEELYREALAISVEALGESHPRVFLAMTRLAGALKSQGKLEEAENLLVKAMEGRRRILGEEHWSVATSMNILAALKEEQQEYKNAEELHRRALAIRKKALPNHLMIAVSHYELGTFLLRRNRLAEAESLLESAVAEARRTVGERSSLVSDYLLELARVRLAQGQRSRAAASCREAIAIRREKLPPAVSEIEEAAALLAEIEEVASPGHSAAPR